MSALPSWLMGMCCACLHPYPLTELRITGYGDEPQPMCAECRARCEAAMDRLINGRNG